MKSLVKTVGILIMAMGVALGDPMPLALGVILVGGVCFFLADYFDDHCPCVCDEEEAEWID